MKTISIFTGCLLCAALLFMGCVKDTIQMAQPTVTITGTYELYKGEALGTLTLTGTAQHEGNPVEGTLAWKDPSTTYPEAGEQPAAWIFTPAAPSRYNPVEGETSVTVNPNIYVCGYRYVSNGDYINTIWKNGNELYTLALAKAIVNSFAVSGGDIYSCGFEDIELNTRTAAKVWKNDQTLYTLAEGGAYTSALSLTIANGKIYTSGRHTLPTGKTVIKVWENEKATLTGERNMGSGYSVAVSGGNVYVFGGEDNDQNKSVAKLWKDGNLLYDNLSDGNYDFKSGNMVISGGDVYACGTEKYNTLNAVSMKVWKNNSLLYDLKSDKNGNVVGLAVSNGDVYMCGWEDGPNETDMIKVWKNGNLLYELTDGNQLSYPYSIELSGDDVYTAGVSYYSGNHPVSKVWKNNVPIFTIDGFVFKAMVID
ncbi:hypothetical protein [uncultured Alistipes sp.]|uniref:hypothetical protein n=1 Tax=uncultured Alistipes sp. TaxID=538949 RepID=UPI0025FBB329|nr:hypothetical protein [uncultured Alistipes sp.]